MRGPLSLRGPLIISRGGPKHIYDYLDSAGQRSRARYTPNDALDLSRATMASAIRRHLK